MSRDIIVILAMALIVVAGWISIDLYKAYTETQAPVVSKETLEPLNPQLDFEVIRDLKNRGLTRWNFSVKIVPRPVRWI